MTLKLYYDLMSQPSRALYIFLKNCNIPFESCSVALRKGEHFTEEFKNQISRFQRVPVIDDNGFKLTESVAIIRYLARERQVPDNWYPKDGRKQARVDEYLEWQHNNTRAFCSLYFRLKWLEPLLSGVQPSASKVENFEGRMSECLDNIEHLWLTPGPFIAGKEFSVADLFAACEIEQPRLADYDPTVGRPKLAAWLEKVRQIPYYKEAHTILNNIVSRNEAGARAKL